MPLIYPESLVKIFQLEMGKITAEWLLRPSVHGRMHACMDDRNTRAGYTIRPLHHTVERSKKFRMSHLGYIVNTHVGFNFI